MADNQNLKMPPEKALLEDLMAAMDVVDTLRHDQSIADRELDQDGRRERLLERLTKLYTAQGIDVPQHVLEEGIDALEQERFKYTPVAPSWQTRVASVWVSRGRWGKPVGVLAVIAILFLGIYVVTDVLPERSLRAALPKQVETNLLAIQNTAKAPEVIEQAGLSAENAKAAIANGDYAKAKLVVANMASVQAQLNQEYSIRVISRANENSGVWRNPPGNDNARNYYLIVEAIDANNRPIELTILNQENNKAVRKKTWGLRVSEATFYDIAADKRDDGIIQNNQVGRKARGFLKPSFNIQTTGATITEW